MIALVVYFAACIVAFSPATAAVKQRFVSERQASSCTLPTQCTQISNEYILLLEGITSPTTPVETINRIADTIGPFLETFCKSDCFDPVLRASRLGVSAALRNIAWTVALQSREDDTQLEVHVQQ